MNKFEGTLFAIAVLSVIGATAVITDQEAELKKYRRYRVRMENWSDIARDLITFQNETTGELPLPPHLAEKLDAYLIFSANDMG